LVNESDAQAKWRGNAYTKSGVVRKAERELTNIIANHGLSRQRVQAGENPKRKKKMDGKQGSTRLPCLSSKKKGLGGLHKKKRKCQRTIEQKGSRGKTTANTKKQSRKKESVKFLGPLIRRINSKKRLISKRIGVRTFGVPSLTPWEAGLRDWSKFEGV